MAALLADFLKSVLQFRDRRFLRVLLIGVALTIALLVAISAAVLIFLGWLLPDAITLPWIGTISFFGAALSWAAVPFLILLSSVMMVPVASAITSMFLDEVAQAVEDNQQGELQGVVTAVNALAMILSPLMMTAVFARFTGEGAGLYLPGAPFLLALLMMAIGCAVFLRSKTSVA